MPLDPNDLDLPILASLIGTALDEATLEALRRSGHPNVRRAHGFVFQHLVEAQPTVGQLAELLQVTPQAASKSVVELETLGYVRREPDPIDSRLRRIALTDQGHDAVASSRRFRADLERAVRDDVGERAVENSRRVLVALLRHLDALDAVAARRVPFPAE